MVKQYYDRNLAEITVDLFPINYLEKLIPNDYNAQHLINS